MDLIVHISMGLQIFKNETAIKTSFPNKVLHELGAPSCPCMFMSMCLTCLKMYQQSKN